MGSKPKKTVKVTITAEVSLTTAQYIRERNRNLWHRTNLNLGRGEADIPAYDLTLKIGKEES
jgi:hypothetical protein